MSHAPQDTAVIIIGGSLVGTSMSLFLSKLGVPSIVVEKHGGTMNHPRALGFTARTIELFRMFGIADRLPPAIPFNPVRARVESLAGQWFERSSWTPDKRAGAADVSPCHSRAIPQDRLEPILREAALADGADFRFGAELVRFDQDAAGVTCQVKPQAGAEYSIRASYLVAADGSHSPVREACRIPRRGLGPMMTLRSVLFRSELDEYLESGASQFEIAQDGMRAQLFCYYDKRWALMFPDGVERDDEMLRSAIMRAIGRTDIPFEILAMGRWELSALVSQDFRSGRVFFAGDAAHTFPPTRGGYGANTGIQDAHNLAWKLAEVLAGRAKPGLLDTYSAERQPVAWTRHQQIFARPDYKFALLKDAVTDPIIDDDAMEFGQLYRSGAVLGAGPELPAALAPDQWAGQPGTRAPHLWVLEGETRTSTLDLFQRSWVLLTQDDAWRDAVARVNGRTQAVLECRCIPPQWLAPASFQTAYGLNAGGASLVRPDGYIAWRSEDLPVDPATTLADAVNRVSFAQARSLLAPPQDLPVGTNVRFGFAGS